MKLIQKIKKYLFHFLYESPKGLNDIAMSRYTIWQKKDRYYYIGIYFMPTAGRSKGYSYIFFTEKEIKNPRDSSYDLFLYESNDNFLGIEPFHVF